MEIGRAVPPAAGYDSERDARATFQNIIAAKEMDMIIIFVKQEAKSKDFLLTEVNRIKQSGSYNLVQENFYQEPFPVFIFFKKI